MVAYMIADVNVTDPTVYEEYRAHAPSVIAQYGGRYLARGGEPVVLEGGWQPHRIVILEFPDMASIKAWHGSPEYAPLRALRDSAATSRFIAVPGV